jgi:hypothetical protein
VVCFETSVVRRRRGLVGIEGKIVLERIKKKGDLEYSLVAQYGVSHSFKMIIDLGNFLD